MSDVRQGQRLNISAGTWNKLQSLARAYDRGDLAGPATPAGDRFDPTVVWIQNKTGAARAQFEIVKIGNPVILPTANEVEFRQQVLLEGVATTDGCQFAVLLEPAAVDAVVKAKIAGVIQAKITKTSTSPALPFSLKVVAAEYKLKQSSGGSAAQAIWAETGEGEKWAYIQLGQAAGKPPLVAKLNEDLLAGVSASATLYEGDPGSLTLSSEHTTVWDGIMEPGDRIAAGSKVWVAPSYGGELYTIVPYCKATGTDPPPIITNPPTQPEQLQVWFQPDATSIPIYLAPPAPAGGEVLSSTAPDPPPPP